MILDSEQDDKDSKDVTNIDTPAEADKEKEPPLRADDRKSSCNRDAALWSC
jgi:hypothetical protein